MEEKIVYQDGKSVKFRLTHEKGFFTRHIWIYKDGKPYLHIVPAGNGIVRVNKNSDGDYHFMGEFVCDFQKVTIDTIKYF